MKSLAIKAELEKAQAEARPLLDRISRLGRELSEAESVEYIAVNRITKADVQFSKGEGVPFFGTIDGFKKWMGDEVMRGHKAKPWFEWNGRIYRTLDLISGDFSFDSPAREEHLK